MPLDLYCIADTSQSRAPLELSRIKLEFVLYRVRS
jgi:hypothetical protein